MQHSSFHFAYIAETELSQIPTKKKGPLLRSVAPKKLPPTSVTLAITKDFQCPAFYIDTVSDWTIDKILDKRLNRTTEKYEYLIGYKRATRLLDCWLPPAGIHIWPAQAGLQYYLHSF